MGKTKIEWCDETINFITGCRGKCSYCYARGTAQRNARMGSARYVAVEQLTGDPFHPTYHHNVMEHELKRLSRATKPRVVFIGSMSDPATTGPWMYLDGTGRGGRHQEVSDTWVQEMIIAFAKELPQHTFILLTKRPDNLKMGPWPSNVWIGVSAADEVSANSNIPYLMSQTQWNGRVDCMGPMRPTLQCGGLFTSIEPLQGGPDPMDFVDPAIFDDVITKPGWIVIGSQKRPKLAHGQGRFVVKNALEIVEWARVNDVPCFIKDNLIRLAPDYSWPRQFPAAFGKADK